MRITSHDELACRLDVTTGMSAFSWGEKVFISVSGNGGQAAMASVRSAAKTVLGSATTYGKNRKNIREILNRTSALLQAHGAKWREEMGLSPMAVSVAAVSVASPMAVSVADELEKLAQLRDRGILSDGEFQAQKVRLPGPWAIVPDSALTATAYHAPVRADRRQTAARDANFLDPNAPLRRETKRDERGSHLSLSP
jgi:hypothetical protein